MKTISIIILTLLAVVGLAACTDEHAGEHCVASHSYTYMMPIKSGSVTTFVPITNTDCDKWEPDV